MRAGQEASRSYKRFLANARPDDDLRYGSNSRARASIWPCAKPRPRYAAANVHAGYGCIRCKSDPDLVRSGGCKRKRISRESLSVFAHRHGGERSLFFQTGLPGRSSPPKCSYGHTGPPSPRLRRDSLGAPPRRRAKTGVYWTGLELISSLIRPERPSPHPSPQWVMPS